MKTQKNRPSRYMILIATTVLLAASVLSVQEKFDIKANYDKAEYIIPMRDGVKLYTQVYTPKDKSQKYPILLFRTPYS
ncbi:unnamed protein product, partial [marine sediment metagenome]